MEILFGVGNSKIKTHFTKDCHYNDQCSSIIETRKKTLFFTKSEWLGHSWFPLRHLELCRRARCPLNTVSLPSGLDSKQMAFLVSLF